MTEPSRYVAGAVDLGEIKARAQQNNGGSPGGDAILAFFTVTEDNLESEVLRRSIQVPVVVMIGTDRAEGNQTLKQDLKELAEAAGLRYLVGYVDADRSPQIAQALGVRALPTVLALAAGRPLANLEGAQPRENLEQWLGAIVEAVSGQLQGLPGGTTQAGTEPESAEPVEDPRLEQATAALNAGAFDAAAAIYDEILAEDPSNQEIKQARGTVQLLKRLDPANRTTDAVQAADAAPADVDKQMEAADAEVVAGAPERAFDRLVETMKRTAGEEKTRVKDRLIELFGLFEASDPRVLAARTKLASALY